MALNLVKTVGDFLKQNPKQKYTARDIAGWVVESYPEECREKQNRSKATVITLDSKAALIQQIVAEIGSSRPRLQKSYPGVKTTETRPRLYYFTESSDLAEIEEVEVRESSPVASVNGNAFNEHDLYPILAAFLNSEFGLYTKRIDEKRSRNSRGPGGNKWLYPDVVALEVLSKDWKREIKDCVQQYADKKTKLWSFEVKILINRSNVREAFFQAVSNSSWANVGYLVAHQIGEDALKELRILSTLHGIGCIGLNAENPSESQIIIPAKERPDIDWDGANRLAEENSDFIEFITLIRQFYQTGDVPRSGWDKIPASD